MDLTSDTAAPQEVIGAHLARPPATPPSTPVPQGPVGVRRSFALPRSKVGVTVRAHGMGLN